MNVTNITYNNTTVINYGPNYEQVNRYAARPVQRMQLQRETTVSNLNLQGGAHRNFNQVSGNQLRVVAPQLQKPTQKIAPKQVKATVKTPKIEHGWKDVPDKEQLQARMKNEDSRNVPPPTIQPRQNRNGEAASAGSQGAQPNDGNNGSAANENNGAKGADQQAGRAARGERANAQGQKGEQAGEAGSAANSGNAPVERQAKQGVRADHGNQAEAADNAQGEQRAKRRGERAQAADGSRSDDQQRGQSRSRRTCSGRRRFKS